MPNFIHSFIHLKRKLIAQTQGKGKFYFSLVFQLECLFIHGTGQIPEDTGMHIRETFPGDFIVYIREKKTLRFANLRYYLSKFNENYL